MKNLTVIGLLLLLGIVPATAGPLDVNADSNMLWVPAIQAAPTPNAADVMLPPPPPAWTLLPDASARFAQSVHFQPPSGHNDSAETFGEAPTPGGRALFGACLLGLAFVRHRRSRP